jgi:hypothetical protein
LTDTLEHTARRIAEHGREALLARLRPAFEQAAAAHADVLKLDEARLEQMIQNAADKADGLQWRRALASVASEQLGIGLGEALNHPAVARAHAIVGAPSYEDSLAELGHRRAEEPQKAAEPEEITAAPGPEPEAAAVASEADDHEPGPAPVAAEAEDHGQADEELQDEQLGAEAPAERGVGETEEWEHDEEFEDEYEDDVSPVGAGLEGESGTLRLRAIHLGGVANLAPAADDIELWLSDAGLDIVRGPEHAPLGRLTWREIAALDVPPPRNRIRRKRAEDAHLVVRGEQGAASFEVPGVAPEELRKHLAPLIERHK